jgi:feruloyl esterase
LRRAVGTPGSVSKNRKLTSSKEKPPWAGKLLFAGVGYCRVEGSIPTGNATEGTNTVRFGVNLPTGWNGRFVMIGDGGFDGALSASTVRVPQGYATANSDMGHSNQQFPGATFGFNNRARELDYGFRATHLTTVAAKGLIDVYYKRGPRFSYWDGCSTGGRQAAVEAQRFPDDFDGIVAGDLFNNAVEVAMEQI